MNLLKIFSNFSNYTSNFLFLLASLLTYYVVNNYSIVHTTFKKILSFIYVGVSFFMYFIGNSYINYSYYQKTIRKNNSIIQQLESINLEKINQLKYFKTKQQGSREMLHNHLIENVKLKFFFYKIGDDIYKNIKELEDLYEKNYIKDFIKLRQKIMDTDYQVISENYNKYSVFTHKLFYFKVYFHYIDGNIKEVNNLYKYGGTLPMKDDLMHAFGLLIKNKPNQSLEHNKYKTRFLYGLFAK